MRTTFTAIFACALLASSAYGQGARAQVVDAPPSGSPQFTTPSLPGPIVDTPAGAEVVVGGTRSYEQLSGPGGGGILTPNGNGTSTIISPSGATQTVPTPR